MCRAFYRKNKVVNQPTEEQIVSASARLAFLNGMNNQENLDEIEKVLLQEYPDYSYAVISARLDADWIYKSS